MRRFAGDSNPRARGGHRGLPSLAFDLGIEHAGHRPLAEPPPTCSNATQGHETPALSPAASDASRRLCARKACVRAQKLRERRITAAWSSLPRSKRRARRVAAPSPAHATSSKRPSPPIVGNNLRAVQRSSASRTAGGNETMSRPNSGLPPRSQSDRSVVAHSSTHARRSRRPRNANCAAARGQPSRRDHRRATARASRVELATRALARPAD